jgi:hypothetical protein
MRCAFCHDSLVYVHGHAACVRPACPFYGRNQAECCSGETAENCAVSTSDAARVHLASSRDDGERG